jgi:LAS superfamily LD-carboxypeptidase LdcB
MNYRNRSNIDLTAIDCQLQALNFINCSNCEFAPVGKTTRLSSAYVPELSLLTLPGGGRVTPATNVALKEMYDAGAAQNIFFRVRSAYRSFEQQQQLFSSRQQALVSAGSSTVNAEIETNRTVAYPYHSEHHLGNTVDLNCHVCLGQQGSKGNAILFKFLQNNANDFGFVISYPQEYIGLTGYKYEPWHLRYIGKELSQEYATRKQTQDISLEQFLHEKSLYY